MRSVALVIAVTLRPISELRGGIPLEVSLGLDPLLTLFVAISLPLTGVYTATFLSWLLAMDWKRAFPAITFGVVIAGVIVLLTTLGVVGGLRLFTEIV